AVVTQRLRHQGGLGLPGGVHRQASRVELDERRGRQVGAGLVGTHDRRGVGVLRQGGHVVHVAVTTGGQDHGVSGVDGELAGDQVAHDQAFAALLTVTFGDDDIDHVVMGEHLDGSEVDLAGQCGCGGQLQLLSGLSTGVVGTGDLHTTEGTGGQGAAVFAGEWCTDGVHVVDDAGGLDGQTPAVGLAAAVVATLDGVFDVAVGGVIVHLLATGGVHATLGGNGVGAATNVVVGERLDVVAEFTECRGGGATGQAGADNQDAELATVQWGDQVHVV